MYIEDGRKYRTMIPINENKLIIQQTALRPGKLDWKIVREFEDDWFDLAIKRKDVVLRQYNKRQD